MKKKETDADIVEVHMNDKRKVTDAADVEIGMSEACHDKEGKMTDVYMVKIHMDDVGFSEKRRVTDADTVEVSVIPLWMTKKVTDAIMIEICMIDVWKERPKETDADIVKTYMSYVCFDEKMK